MDTDPTPAPASRPPVLPHVLRLDLLGDDEPLRQARRFVRLQAEQLGLEDAADDAVQVTAELLGGLGAGSSPTVLRVGEAAGALVVGVDVRFADGRTRPVLSGHTRDLLRQLSGETGWSPTDGGAQLWCRVP
ncbi:hypothetical protein AB1207_15525 [Kineococcus endophyticus]|uniref:Uncharacterized protein n=1 Tax=Kineococcus endophyticus TaxID=1181883 RepID=A0ABV3P964_9ACTN